MSVTIQEAIRRLKTLDSSGLPRATKSAIYRSLAAGRERALDVLAKTTMGQAVRRRGDVQLRLAGNLIGPLRGGRPTGASSIPLIVQRVDVKESGMLSGRRYMAGLRTMGFAALLEAGGRTKAHTIKPIRLGGYSRKRRERVKQLLAEQPMRFRIGGRWVTARIVTHPGSRVPRNPFLRTGVSAAERELPAQFDRAIGDAIKAAGLNG